MIRKLLIVLVAVGFIGTAAYAKAKKELTPEQIAKREAWMKKKIAHLEKTYPTEIAEYNKLMADGKKKEAHAVMKKLDGKVRDAQLDKMAEKYPEDVAALKKLLEEGKKKEFQKGFRDLRKKARDDYKKNHPKKKKGRRKAKKAKERDED
tara:strand:+ start:168 stop:617 length:450 start_codon:yes stop_codon:yes gene_type:complete